MARDPPLLSSQTPIHRAPAMVTIGHVQLRDVLICPNERGTVNYVRSRSIAPRTLADLAFLPNTLTSLPVPGTDHTLLAAGGQDAEIHLSLLGPESHSAWQFNTHLEGSINNSILLTSLSLTDSNESSAEPRMAVSNNDRVVMFFDVPVRSRPSTITQVGAVRFNVPVNHSSISPDGRTLLSVGDSSKVFLHRLTGGAHVSAAPIATLTLPPTNSPFNSFFSPALVASFSTAFSADGSKYAVAAQEGAVAVWDVRSSRPLKVFTTDKSRGSAGAGGNSGAYGNGAGMDTTWLSEDPVVWSHRKSRGPGWSARNVKFGGRPGREIMLFTEHTSLIHVIDARTFETEEILHMPSFPAPASVPSPRTTRARYGVPPPSVPSTTPSSYTTTSAPRTRTSTVFTPIPAPRVSLTTTPRTTSNTHRIVRTLEDAFRVADEAGEGAGADVLVIPTLGDRAVEREVRRVLGHHGVSTRMDVDEAPQRGDESDEDEDDGRDECDDGDSMLPSPSSASTSSAPRADLHQLQREVDLYEDEEEERYNTNSTTPIDIAGACFDPHGAYVYVASEGGVAEWGVRGAEKRWWAGVQGGGKWER
ncbi:hypothetical protein K438DRAFT_1908688 [Mycena galopus ATCC 62051]|nr:hypothetical protein K438DRAFT_1908688 [Mycena galopus ATCC 62051]